jgi:hypothetical protein
MKPVIKQIGCLLMAGMLILHHTSCRKYKFPYNTETVSNHSQLPDTNILPPASPIPLTPVYYGEFTFENLSWQKDSLYTPSGFNILYSLIDFNPFKNIIPNEDYDSTYYNDHLKVIIHFSSWVTIPYVVLDFNRLPNHDIYFISNNYTFTLPIGGHSITIVLPGIKIYAKPNAAIDFSKKFSVRVKILP